MSIFETGSPRITFQVQPGSNVTRLTALKSGTLYAVLLRGAYGSRTTGVIQPGTAGVAMGQVPWASLPAEVQSKITSLQAETGVSYPNGFVVAGGSANMVRNIPTWYIDKESSQDTMAVVRAAVPDFNSPTPSYLAGVRMRISTDGGNTYGRFEDIKTPFQGGVNYATFSVPVPYEQTVLVQFQAIYKDGTFGRATRPVKFTGVAKPANPPVAAPVIGTITGAYSYSTKNNKLQLQVTVPVTPDPASGSALVQFVDGAGKVRASHEVPNSTPHTPLAVVLDDVDPSVASYTVNAYSNAGGKLSQPTQTTWAVSSATGYVPPKFDPTKVFLSEEIYRMGDGTLESRIRVKFEGAVDAERTRGAVYIRRRDNFGGDLNTFAGFTRIGISSGNLLTDGVFAGSTVQWDVVVLAVGKDGSEAAFSSDQIKTVSVVQYANYVPPQQAVPTVTVSGENSVVISGTYTRAPGTPEPIKLRAYKSQTSILAGDLVGEAVYTYLGDGTYSYALTVNDLAPFSVGSNNYDITLRTILENQGLTPTASKTTVRVTRALPSAPTLSSATPYVKTVKCVVTGFAALTAGAQSDYTPSAGGNGATITITPPKAGLQVEISDAGATPGNNPEIVTNASVDSSTGVVTCTPATNSGSRDVRVRWTTSFGNSSWSNHIQIAFPIDNVVDSTVPDLTPCVPRFTQNSDGSIAIAWTAATFGTSGLGNYVIRRNSSNAVGTSTVVGTITTNTNLSFTDFIDFSRIGQTFYYWLEAVSAQGVKSAAPLAVKLASANSYAVETVVAAVSTDSAPAVPTGLVVKGAQGGFDIIWANNTERDLKEYVLEFSAAGTFADTVTYTIKGTSYFQTAGATAPKATADVYRWRLKARDFGGNISAATANAVPDNASYGSVTDTAPNAPSAVVLANNQDGSITLTISAPGANPGTYYRILRRSKTSAGWTETDGAAVIENDIQIPATATTYRDTGLKPGTYYNYRVYSRSKLGTESASYAAATSPIAATDTTAPSAPSLAVVPNFGVSSVTVTPAEAGGSIELWCNSGTITWNAGTAQKIAEAQVGPVANAVAFAIGELDAANPVNKAYAARHIDAWGNISGWSTAATAMSLNFLRAEMIDATHVKAASMTVDKMVVGAVQRQSLVSNGHFGTYNTFGDAYNGWTLGSGAVFASTGDYTPGDGSSALPVARFTRTDSGLLAEQGITVLPGQTYTVVGLVYIAQVGTTAALRVMAPDGTTRLSSATNNPSAGSVIPDFYKGQGIAGVQTNNADCAAGAIGWKLIAYKVTIPLGTTTVRLQLFLDAASGSTQIHASFIQMYSDTLSEASASADQVNQLKAIAYGGDVSGTYDALTVRSIQNRLVGTTAPTDKQTLAWDAATSKYTPMSVATMLGFTPANRAGDTFVGPVSMPSLDLPLANNWSYIKNSAELGGLKLQTSGVDCISATSGGNYITLHLPTTCSSTLTATQFNGSGAGLTGTAVSLTVGNASHANDSDLLGGLGLGAATGGPGANKVVRTQSNGFTFLSYVNINNGVENQAVASVLTDNGDGYIRKNTLADLVSKMDLSAKVVARVVDASTGSSFLSQRDDTTVSVRGTVAADSYRAYVQARSITATFTLGSLGDSSIGFYRFLNSRDTNGTDNYAYMNSVGNWEISGAFYGAGTGLTGSAPNLTAGGVSGGSVSGTTGTFSGLVRTGSQFYCDQNYGSGLVGLYDATKFRSIYAMGESFKMALDGSALNAMYGLAFTHSNAGGESKAVEHQLLVVANGITQSAIGTGIWSIAGVSATNFTSRATNGTGLRLWDVTSGDYSVYMSATGDATWGGGWDTANATYNLYLRMTGLKRGFVFQNPALHSETGAYAHGTFAHIKPHGIGGMLVLKDTTVAGKAYGLYFSNGALYGAEVN